MDQPKAIEAKAGDVTVIHKMLALELSLVFWIPVAVDRQNLIGSTVNRDNIGQGDSCRLSILTNILHAFDIQLCVDLKDLIAVVIGGFVTLLFCLFLLNVREDVDRLAKLNISVEACDLQLLDLVLCFTHYMCNTFCVVQIGGSVGNNDILGWDEHCHFTAKARVVVNLLKGGSGQTQGIQEALMFWAVLWHLLG